MRRAFRDRYPAPLEGNILTDIFSSREDAAYDTMLSVALPAVYGSNWLSQLYPLTRSNVLALAKNLSYYHLRGYAYGDWRSIKAAVQKAFPSLDPVRVSAALAMLEGLPADRYPAYIQLIRTGKWMKDEAKAQGGQTRTETLTSVADSVKDKVAQGTREIAKTFADTASYALQDLPWFLQPKFLLIGGAVVGGLFLLGYSGVGKALIRPKYKTNPVPRSELAARKYREFHGFNPGKTVRIPEIDTSHLTELGKALEIGYRSGKWTGKPENYLHQFGKGVRLMATPDGKALVISGGQLDVKDVGIVN